MEFRLVKHHDTYRKQFEGKYNIYGTKDLVLSWAFGIPTLQHLCLCPFPSTPVQLESHCHRPQRSQELRPLRLERPLVSGAARETPELNPAWLMKRCAPLSGGIETTPHHDAIKKTFNDLTKPQCGWMMLKSEPTFFTIVGLLCRHVTGLP